MSEIKLKKFNEVYVKVETSKDIESELYDYFTFMVPGYKYSPKYKARIWDGKKHLYNKRNRQIYKGLINRVREFCKERNYDFIDEVSEKITPINDGEIKEFSEELKMKRIPRDYQVEYIKHCINNERAVLLSPTSSGKSLIIYFLCRWYNIKTLIIVPTISLCMQMKSDFIDYTGDDWDPENEISMINSGRSKENLNNITVSTWQSIFEQGEDFFNQFDMVIGDEIHGAKAASYVKIMENLKECKLRFGMTGTLDGIQLNELQIVGTLGEVKKVVSTSELIEQGFLSEINIKCFLLNYNKETRKNISKKYPDEIKFLITNKRRNRFLCNLANKLKGNVLLLYQYVDTHGELLYNEIKNLADSETDVFFIHGGIKGEERERIRKYIDNTDRKCILIASVGTSAVGVNIVNLNNIIFASPSKSRIRVLQSIGRGLRKSGKKNKMTLFDIADDLSKSKRSKNYTLLHFLQRLKIYGEEKFSYTINKIDLE